MDEAKFCLRTCNDIPFDPLNTGNATLEEDGSLLNDCLDPSREDGSIDSLDGLVECCQMENDCEKELEDAQECVQNCFDPCIRETSLAYLDCINDENDGVDSNRCSRQSCLDGFLEDLEDDADFSGDILDLGNVEKRLTKIEQEDLEECSLLEDFVEAACDIGEDCCERCNTELATTVDCLINDIVIPFVAIELNTTIEECPISEDCKLEFSGSRKAKARKTTAQEEEIFNKALSLTKRADGLGQSKRNLAREAALKKADRNRVLEAAQTSEEAVTACENAMNMNTISHNVTFAVSKFMECLTAAGISMLPDEVASGDGTSAASAASLATLVATTLVASFFAF